MCFSVPSVLAILLLDHHLIRVRLPMMRKLDEVESLGEVGWQGVGVALQGCVVDDDA